MHFSAVNVFCTKKNRIRARFQIISFLFMRKKTIETRKKIEKDKICFEILKSFFL